MTTGTRQNRTDLYSGLVAIVIAGACWFWLIPFRTANAKEQGILKIIISKSANQPGFFPAIVTIMLFIVGLVLTLEYAYAHKGSEESLSRLLKAAFKSIKAENKMLPIITALLAYGLLVNGIGFWTTTTILLGTLLYYSGVKDSRFLALYLAATMGGLYIFFSVIVQVRFPSGLLF
ncbi:MAG TPA: tripartite tricarboxylate transporter TctB family protein [bacterium]|nr:tripartite tricarboxylate transporter TctB family protein [bacterium]